MGKRIVKQVENCVQCWATQPLQLVATTTDANSSSAGLPWDPEGQQAARRQQCSSAAKLLLTHILICTSTGTAAGTGTDPALLLGTRSAGSRSGTLDASRELKDAGLVDPGKRRVRRDLMVFWCYLVGKDKTKEMFGDKKEHQSQNLEHGKA